MTSRIQTVLAVACFAMVAGCGETKTAPQPAPATQAAPTAQEPRIAPAVKAAPVAAPTPAAAAKAIRIDAGATAPFTDKSGNVWMADKGFTEGDGDVVDRGDIKIENTDMPQLYRTEHFGMTAFSTALPNGKYLVKLHFAETFDGITGPGERVFSIKVEDKELKDIDVFKEAGGLNKALVKSVPVEVKDGKLDITFIANVQSPEINGIEIIPQ